MIAYIGIIKDKYEKKSQKLGFQYQKLFFEVMFMLVEFCLENVFSFGELSTLSMVSAGIKGHEEENIISTGSMTLLRSVAVYGANASGKTNLVKAFSLMKHLILRSASFQMGDPITSQNIAFQFNSSKRRAPSFFEVTILLEDGRYRYGFAITSTRVISEWFYRAKTSREALLFKREGQNIELGDSFKKEGRPVEERVKDNSLFLSTVGQFNGETAGKIIRWFQKSHVIRPNTDYLGVLFSMLENDDSLKNEVLRYLKYADFSIDNFSVDAEDVSLTDLPDEIASLLRKSGEGHVKKMEVMMDHPAFDNENNFCGTVGLKLRDESDGTQKFFALLGPVLTSLKNGGVLMIDEMDARFHPMLTTFLVKLFHSSKTNTANAQLIFNTHNVKLLNQNIFRRDQVWFTERNNIGSSDLFSLVEFRERLDRDIEKGYLQGRYGAIPNIEDLFSQEENE